MDNEHVEGAANKVVGETKEAAGHAAGDKELEPKAQLIRRKEPPTRQWRREGCRQRGPLIA
jgi:hypothetical protein